MRKARLGSGTRGDERGWGRAFAAILAMESATLIVWALTARPVMQPLSPQDCDMCAPPIVYPVRVLASSLPPLPNLKSTRLCALASPSADGHRCPASSRSHHSGAFK